MNPALAAIAIVGGYLIVRMRKPWAPPAAAEPYLPTIGAAEAQYGIPHNLLTRLLERESGFRPEVISGEVRSSAGAVGIAQIVPRWHPDVDPTDPIASIWYAAGYLARLKAQFGTWTKALAAYNWGEGNLADAIEQRGESWFVLAPAETKAYVSRITRDVRVA